MGKRQMYLLAVPMTEEEAEALLKVAGKRGQDIGTFISGIVTDIHNGAGDEGDLIEAYLDRSDPPAAEESYTAFCLRNGYDLDTLGELNRAMENHRQAAGSIKGDLENGSFTEANGWLPGATAEDAREELAFHEEAIEEAAKEKAALWEEYREAAALWGGGVDEGEALAEVEAFQREAATFQRERMTAAAKALLEKER